MIAAAALVATAIAAAPRSASALELDGLVLQGSATYVDSVLQLTPDGQGHVAGAAWSSTPVDLNQDLSTSFSASLSGGDGIALVLQSSTAGTTAIGGTGGGLGYKGIAPSVAVEFDIWNNRERSGDEHPVNIHLNGDETVSSANADLDFSLTSAPFTAWITYDSAAHRLAVFVSQSSSKPAAPVLEYPIDLAAVLGASPTFWGFTGATGFATGTQRVLGWDAAEVPPEVRSVRATVTRRSALYHMTLRLRLENARCGARLDLQAGRITGRVTLVSIAPCLGSTDPEAIANVDFPVFEPGDRRARLRPGSTVQLHARLDDGPVSTFKIAVPKRPVWVGIGDSYSSGHHQDRDRPLCPSASACGVAANDGHFSWIRHAVGMINDRLRVPGEWKMQHVVAARSGTRATDLQRRGQVPQMERALRRVKGTWNVVSMTGGANDADFTKPLRDFYGEHKTGLKPWRVTEREACPDTDYVHTQAQRHANAIETALENAARAAEAASPGIRILDVNYPYVVGRGNVCAGNQQRDGRTWHGANAVVDELARIHRRVDAPGIIRIDLRPLLDRSEALSDLQRTGYFGYPHPDTSGQKAIAEAALARLLPRSGTSR